MRPYLKRVVVTYEFKGGYFTTLNRLIKLNVSEEHVTRFNPYPVNVENMVSS